MKKAECSPKVSIILPVYNAKEYLRRCLDSVLRQTYDNLEILCIDDGSTDGSDIILEEYSEKDERIRTVHKENGGESSARNAGLRMMTGQYVGFMDCDDWIEPDMYEKLAAVMMTENVDMAASAWYRDTPCSSVRIRNEGTVSGKAFGREELLNYIYRRDIYRAFAYMWDKLYKRRLFYDGDGNLMLFDEDLKLGGDVLYLAKLAFRADSAFYIDEPFYHYSQRENSGSHTRDLEKREDWLEAYRRILDYINSNGIETGVIPWIKRFLAYHGSNVAELAYIQENQRVLTMCQNIMEQYGREYYLTNQRHPDRIQRYEKILSYRLADAPKRRRLAIFSFYDQDGIADSYVIYLLTDLKKVADYLIVAVNGKINRESESKIKGIADKIVKRENAGFDAGAYADVIENVIGKKGLTAWDEVVLCNDTFYGPFVPFEDIFREMTGEEADFWGLNYVEDHIANHIQSYFLVFRKPVIQSGHLFDFFAEEISSQEKELKNIYAWFEAGIFSYLKKLGYRFGVYADVRNCSVYYSADICIERYRFPILKKKAFNGRYLDADQQRHILRYISVKTNYDIKHILQSIGRLYHSNWEEKDFMEGELENSEKAERKQWASQVTEEEIIRFLLDGKEIYIYGTGMIGRKIWHFYHNYIKRLNGFIISDGERMVEKTLYGFPVRFYSEIEEGATIIVGMDDENTQRVRNNIKGRDKVLFLC